MNPTATTAQSILDRAWDGMLPVDITKMAKRLGVDVNFVNEDTASDDRAIVKLHRNEKETWTVTCNANESSLRNRFALAHALAHHILKHVSTDQVGEYGLSSFRSDATQDDKVANALASRLLVPAKVMMFAINHRNVTTIEKLSSLFEVSPVLMKARLEDEGVLKPSSTKKPRP